MAPAKKREKDNALAAPAAAISNVANGSVNSVNGGGVSSATAAAASAVTASTASINVDNVKLNGHQQEQELFLQAFEKPTQIYRFLRNRHGTSPIFLNRTLSYMKDRMSRNNKKRTTFKVNSILQQITQKAEIDSNKYLNIIYNGLFDKSSCSDQWWNAGESVSVEATLYKITKNKRKDSTSDFQEVMSYSSDVEYNPDHDISRFSTISIPVQSMRPLGDQHTIYKLLFRIKVLPKCDKNAIDENTENCETPCKRGKISTKIYGCELIVFEKNICFIPEGDYEAAMQELNSMSIKSFSPKKRTWETLPDNYIPLSLKFDVFNQFPTLKFRLTWSANEVPSSIDAKDFNLYGDLAFIKNEANDKIQNNPNEVEMPFNSNANQTKNIGTHVNHNNNCVKTNGAKSGIVPVSAKVEKIQIVYNFLYSNNTRQQTEYTQEVICPWCGLDCLRLYALLKHLKLCHARFNFTYQPAGNGARIDVTINDSYDGSYAGSPYDLAGPSGCSFARTCGPVRRTTVTNLLVCRPRRQKTCLDEFLVLDEDDLSNQRPYITGHNRLYHHTETCLPVHPKELDIDSEGESDPLWLRQKTIQMIDEFSDVNEGEKELMKLWNLHVMKHGYVGDCQLPLACEMFLDSNGYEIIRKNLYRNFILHMCSLFDYGLVSPETVYKTVQKLQGMLSKYPEGQELMSKQREAQLKYWLDVGIHKQDEQKLKSPQKQTLKPTNISEVLGTADNDVCGTSSVSKNTENKPMQPPTKRSATAVKRASLHLQNGNGNSTSDKLINGCGSKGVAKKTASQAVDDQEPPANTSANSGSAKMPSDKRERRGEACSNSRRSSTASAAVTLTTIDRDENNESKDAQNLERPHRGGSVSTNSTTTAESRTQTSKRRLSVKDASQPACKRSRNSEGHNSGSGSGIGGTTTRTTAQRQSVEGVPPTNSSSGKQTNAICTTTANSLTTTLPKRLVTRRQSIASTTNTNHNNNNNATEPTLSKSSAKNTNIISTTTSANVTHHSLRTRLSVPLTKVDKR
ncbi:polycomb protein Su(z)12 isoform X2 [Bactrocera neohumeralis]|uniref:polycomb protein Su(z)12-like isoform X1 n=1 Tax=Bactrocera tryoni TaxID=59916 RepID=UPI001A99EAE6|nr:polycomb protein Su(z)12-like isoform X1 [Bactrocera tryoni]XP_050334410.1 polycomb protein Su(z)12 isoform X2 [Bactrocera neohumeralis]